MVSRESARASRGGAGRAETVVVGPWRPRRRRPRPTPAGSPRRRKGSWRMARSVTMTTTASAPMAADPSMPAASVAAVAAAAVAGRTRGAGRPPGSTGAAPCPPPGGPSRARGTSLRPTQDTCTATAGTGLRTRSAPTRRRRGCRRARTPTRAPGSPSGSAATTPWIGSASEAGPTGAVGAGAGAEAVAIGRATLRGGRPEGEAAPGSVAARAGGSPRLGNVSLRRERGGGPVLLRWAWAWPCRATWPKAVGRDAFPSALAVGVPQR